MIVFGAIDAWHGGAAEESSGGQGPAAHRCQRLHRGELGGDVVEGFLGTVVTESDGSHGTYETFCVFWTAARDAT